MLLTLKSLSIIIHLLLIQQLPFYYQLVQNFVLLKFLPRGPLLDIVIKI